VGIFRGAELDVIGRLHQTAASRDAAVLVRLTADDALMDPEVVDYMVRTFEPGRDDCVTSLTSQSFPNGFVLSVIDAPALERLTVMSLSAFEREHVIPAFLNRPSQFHCRSVAAPPEWQGYDLSATLDTPTDLDLVREIVEHFGGAPSLQSLLSMLRGNPDWNRRALAGGRYWELNA
jgi:spore coat polysaccharide biosynthesis protein SpsF (cytidylyltransferase family)